MLFEIVFSVALNIISSLGYLGVFILMTLESMVFPIPSEAVMPFAGFLVASGNMDFVAVIIASTLGSIFGSLVSYYIGMKGELFIEKHGHLLLLNKNDMNSAKAFFKKHGEKTIFVSRFIPVIRHLISIPAGLGRMDLKKFILYTTAGAAMWNTFLAYLGFILKEKWNEIVAYSQYLDIIAVIGIITFALWFVRRHR
ncbi:MAG: DedA family protein [Candidatus Aenigmarchaeota archaeon]|nr:DedA family protein [Candidatus Aenigmarchaeota archaeon]